MYTCYEHSMYVSHIHVWVCYRYSLSLFRLLLEYSLHFDIIHQILPNRALNDALEDLLCENITKLIFSRLLKPQKCNVIAKGFRFMPLSLVRLRTFRLSTLVS